MADPRAIVRYEGIAPDYATFKIDNSTITYSATASSGSSQVGMAVTLSADQTVALAADNNAVLGKLIRVGSDNFATVQVAGGMTLPAGSSVTLTAGQKVVGCLGPSSAKGYIRNPVALTGSYVQTTQQDIANSRGIVVDASSQASNGPVGLFLY